MVPQTPALPHVTDHVTPAFDASSVTVAVSIVLPRMVRLDGALTATEIVFTLVMVPTATALCGWLRVSVALAVAVMLTVPPVGTTGGDWYETACPLLVCDGVRLPQLPNGLVHLRVQSAPMSELSLLTVAIRFAVSPETAAPTVKAEGETLIVIAGGVVMVTDMLAVTVGSATEVAVITTGDAGAAKGALYTTEVELLGVKVPQAPDAVEPQDADHVTPALVESFATTTE
jgi:hypothetical protein